jgi:prepilin-type N-terminal cleavage/methylation domain-containing protein
VFSQKGRRVKASTKRAAQSGFSLIEVLIGIVVLAIVAGAITQGFASSGATIGRSRVDTAASTLASARLDQAQRLAYEDLGTVGGNPPGVFVASETRTVSGTSYTVDTRVEYVDDPALGQPRTYVNYKKVTVTVTPEVANPRPITETTVISPPSFGAIAGKATAVITVLDSLTNEPLDNVAVTIDGSTSASRTGRTDANGNVVFAGLEPSATSPTDPKYRYQASASFSPYVTHPDTLPATIRQHLAASQTWNATIQMFKPSEIVVNLYDNNTPIDTYADVKVTLPAPSTQVETHSGYTGGFLFTTVATGLIEPSSSATIVDVTADCYAPATQSAAVPQGYPTSNSHTFNFDLERVAGNDLNVTVVDRDSGAPIPGAQVSVSAGEAALAPVRTRSTDANGKVSFCLPYSGALEYMVEVAAPGHGAGGMPAVVAAGAPTPVPVTLVAASATASVRLTAPVANAVVRLQARDGTFNVYKNTGAGTSFDFTGLAPGTYDAFVATAFSGSQPTGWSPAKQVNAPGSTTVP